MRRLNRLLQGLEPVLLRLARCMRAAAIVVAALTGLVTAVLALMGVYRGSHP